MKRPKQKQTLFETIVRQVLNEAEGKTVVTPAYGLDYTNQGFKVSTPINDTDFNIISTTIGDTLAKYVLENIDNQEEFDIEVLIDFKFPDLYGYVLVGGDIDVAGSIEDERGGSDEYGHYEELSSYKYNYINLDDLYVHYLWDSQTTPEEKEIIGQDIKSRLNIPLIKKALEKEVKLNS